MNVGLPNTDLSFAVCVFCSYWCKILLEFAVAIIFSASRFPILAFVIIPSLIFAVLVTKAPVVNWLAVIVFAAIWIEERNNILSYLSQAGVIVLTLNIVMMIFAYYLAKVFSSNIEQRRCIAIECGLQNGTLAVFVATQIFNDIIYIIPTAAYALIMYITAFIFMYLLRNSN